MSFVITQHNTTQHNTTQQNFLLNFYHCDTCSWDIFHRLACCASVLCALLLSFLHYSHLVLRLFVARCCNITSFGGCHNNLSRASYSHTLVSFDLALCYWGFPSTQSFHFHRGSPSTRKSFDLPSLRSCTLLTLRTTDWQHYILFPMSLQNIVADHLQ